MDVGLMALTLCSFKITSHYFLYIAKYTMLYTVTVCWVFVVCLKLDWWQLIVEMFLSIVSRHCEVYYKKSTCTVFYTRIQGLTNLWQMLPRGTLQLLLLLLITSKNLTCWYYHHQQKIFFGCCGLLLFYNLCSSSSIPRSSQKMLPFVFFLW